jgi:hypothetical protein
MASVTCSTRQFKPMCSVCPTCPASLYHDQCPLCARRSLHWGRLRRALQGNLSDLSTDDENLLRVSGELVLRVWERHAQDQISECCAATLTENTRW